MPGTPSEYVRFVARLLECEADPAIVDVHCWTDGSEPTEAEFYDVMALYSYVRRQRDEPKQRRAQARALRLLRSLLTPEQRRQLRVRKCFEVVTPSGNRYRLYPRFGQVELVTRHGSRSFAKASYCLHEDRSNAKARLPPGDLSIAHMLLLLADEPWFQATANATDRRDQLWNREYLRRMRSRPELPTGA